MTIQLTCLLCGRPVPAFEPPHAELHELSRICNQHSWPFLMAEGFHGLHGPDLAYDARVPEISKAVAGSLISEICFTGEYFTLLLRLSSDALLLIVPIGRGPIVHLFERGKYHEGFRN